MWNSDRLAARERTKELGLLVFGTHCNFRRFCLHSTGSVCTQYETCRDKMCHLVGSLLMPKLALQHAQPLFLSGSEISRQGLPPGNSTSLQEL